MRSSAATAVFSVDPFDRCVYFISWMIFCLLGPLVAFTILDMVIINGRRKFFVCVCVSSFNVRAR